MSIFDKSVIQFLKIKGQSMEGTFAALVEMIAREGNTHYIDHLIAHTKTKNMLGLANYINSFGVKS